MSLLGLVILVLVGAAVWTSRSGGRAPTAGEIERAIEAHDPDDDDLLA